MLRCGCTVLHIPVLVHQPLDLIISSPQWPASGWAQSALNPGSSSCHTISGMTTTSTSSYKEVKSENYFITSLYNSDIIVSIIIGSSGNHDKKEVNDLPHLAIRNHSCGRFLQCLNSQVNSIGPGGTFLTPTPSMPLVFDFLLIDKIISTSYMSLLW